MFSTPERLAARTPKDGVGRFEFLELLVKEFKTTKSAEAKEQVLANLANFAYDPVNYEFLRKLSVIDLFLDQLGENNRTLRQYALGGLCNLALDRENKAYIVHCGGVNKISLFLSDSDEEVVLSAITTLMFLVNPQSKKEITKPDNLRIILEHSRSENKRISNLANIFLQDYCTSEQINAVLLSEEVQNIPIPDQNLNLLKGTMKKIHLQVGQTVEIKRTVMQAELDEFMKISGDCNEVHMQKPALVHGALLNSLVSGVIGTRLPGHGTLLLEQNLRFPNPCYVNEEITITVTIESVKRIVGCSFVCNVIDSNNKAKAVMTGSAKLLCR